MRDGLAGLLGTQPQYLVVAEAGTAAEGIEALERSKPDLVVVDLRLPDADGSRVLEAARKLRWQTYTIVLSAFKAEDDLVAAARAGARAYLTKTASGSEVLAAIARVLAGENLLDLEMGERLRERVLYPVLTAKELEILTLLGSGLSNKEIGRKKRVSANTVKVHLRNIFAKLNVQNRAQAAAVALRRGLVEG